MQVLALFSLHQREALAKAVVVQCYRRAMPRPKEEKAEEEEEEELRRLEGGSTGGAAVRLLGTTWSVARSPAAPHLRPREKRAPLPVASLE